MECSLAEVIAAKGQTFKRGLVPYRQQMGDMGVICVYAEEHTGHKDTVSFEYSGSNLDKKDLFSESDPFFTVSRVNPDDSYTVVYRSDYIKDEPAPSWPPVTITSDKLCNGDWNRRLKVEIFDYNDRYLQSGPSSVPYLDLLVAVLIYVYVSQNLLEN